MHVLAQKGVDIAAPIWGREEGNEPRFWEGGPARGWSQAPGWVWRRSGQRREGSEGVRVEGGATWPWAAH